MKWTITTTSQSLLEILWDTKYKKLLKQKTWDVFAINIQNLTNVDLYMERNDEATVSDWYKISWLKEVYIKTSNLDDLNFIADWVNATDIRFIWN